jgi:glycosyltransferase involved in cell wall biosynthesis
MFVEMRGMNVLFLSLMGYSSIKNRDIYTDLLREFINQGHKVYVVSPAERRQGIETGLIQEENSTILRVKTGNIQKTNLIEKGISTVMLEPQFVAAIKKYFGNIKFDLVLYSTPPITIAKAVEYVKKRDGATTYLMLKDIFPQNAVDIGMMTTSGIKGLLYKSFRSKEKKLYALSDHIGCMSQANVDYVLKHNPEIPKERVEISPNCVEVTDMSVAETDKKLMREKYGIPQDKIVYLYGGNLGKPQGIDHMIECFKSQKDNNKAFFFIIGSGTEFGKIEEWVKSEPQENVKLMSKLPKEDYIRMVGSCDIGLLFLDHRFTIPNFPSRLVDYMQSKLPTLACTDPNSDVGQVMIEGGFGWWCESNSTEDFRKAVEESMNADIKAMGDKAFKYLGEVWNVKKQYRDIAKTIGWVK